MCSAELILRKNQRDFTLYLMSLYKWNFTADIFLGIFGCCFFFSDKLLYKAAPNQTLLIVKCFYFLRMWNDSCFLRSPQRQLSQCNRRNTATFFRTLVKSHKGLKGTKVFVCWFLEKISEIYYNSEGRGRGRVFLL